jgi:TetR/AcrR family transcriptional regulator, transcriptional repressor for nem operon
MNKGQETKARITELSARLFNTKGFHGTSLADIMNITGMEKGGIYNHFSNKDEIGLAAFDLCYVRILERFKDHYTPDGDREQKLLSIIRFYESLWDNPIIDGNFPLIGLGMYAAEINNELLIKVKQAFEKLEYIISVILQEEMTEEEAVLNPDFIFSAVCGSLFLSFYFNEARYIKNTTKIIRQLIYKTK